jgi:hypothetical protein
VKSEFRPAIEWLEAQYEYLADDFVHPNVRSGEMHEEDIYTNYMASFKYDVCAEKFCDRCKNVFPQFITSVAWTDKDANLWDEHGIPGSEVVRDQIRAVIHHSDARARIVVERD